LRRAAPRIRLNLEGEEIARKVYRWPEPRGHCLLKAGLGYFYQGELGRAAELFQHARAFLDEDRWLRWRWEIPLLRAEAELALAEGRRRRPIVRRLGAGPGHVLPAAGWLAAGAPGPTRSAAAPTGLDAGGSRGGLGAVA
jgi:hypothetical protein